jgi:hypothetical protein
MLTQMSLLDTDNCISLPVLADGPLPPALPDGLMIVKSSPARARASRSRSPAKVRELLMQGTYGPTFSESSVPEGPLASWENRLRQRLARIGSSECELTWKASDMPGGGLLSRLVPSTPRIVEIDCGLLMETSQWATATARDWRSESASPEFQAERMAHPRGKTLPTQVLWTAAHWSSPRASDGEKGGPNQAFGAGGQPLPAQVFHAALYPTPSASGFEAKDPERLKARRAECKERTSNGNGFGLTLGQFVCLESAMWPTARANEANEANGDKIPPGRTGGLALKQAVQLATPGTALSGLSATTEKRGVLNPAFVCWLMGYPIAHLLSGATAMRLLPRSQRK